MVYTVIEIFDSMVHSSQIFVFTYFTSFEFIVPMILVGKVWVKDGESLTAQSVSVMKKRGDAMTMKKSTFRDDGGKAELMI